MANTTSGYIEQQRRGLTEQALAKAIRLDDWLNEAIASTKSEGLLPPESYMNVIGSHDAEHFTNAMKLFALEIFTRCRATPSSRFLDLGCGCGRLALPIARFLGSSGGYDGVDVWKEGIAWCKENITARSPNVRFHAVHANDNYYFEENSVGVRNEYRLDFLAAESVDIAFAISLFTHLRHADAFSYLQEIGRLLKPDGLAYVTCFIIDHFFFEYIARTGNHREVTESRDDKECFYAYSKQDFFAGFSMSVWNCMLREAGLWAICHETGSWAEKPGARLYQDTFVLGKLRGAA